MFQRDWAKSFLEKNDNIGELLFVTRHIATLMDKRLQGSDALVDVYPSLHLEPGRGPHRLSARAVKCSFEYVTP